MAQVKIGQFKFGEDTFNLRYVVDGEIVKFVAKDVANSLKYENTKDSIKKHIDEKYKSTSFEQGSRIATLGQNTMVKQGDPLYLHPSTVFITKEGVIQLIMKSKLPYAVELQAWLLEEVIPQVLCTGKYAPSVAMDMTELEVVKNENKQLIATLNNANEKLVEANEKILYFANALVTANTGLVQANTMLNDARKETAQLANRMADIAQDVIAKPSDPQLLHSLAVCALGNEEYAFIRAQKRSLNRSLKRLSSSDVMFKSDYVPNAMNVLNRVKESIPRDKFKAKHNKIRLLENFSKEQLMDVVKATMTERQIARININNNLNNTL
ncbi:bro-g [Cyclophragma undans nucleopolyhedrovirus]|uniref:Bro-g n=1 Tax=Cyclophragma undans nucleopolyhedrovirus TaxID=1906244 RepID=A0A288Q7H9_9ABAC|nr:bro-g [Cyclophragma undans nucleopolyhedrovirus]AOT85518.1 bro-g [Cyclophragma undans nucleopolyhedrovirus]